jgi:hypothetical protein
MEADPNCVCMGTGITTRLDPMSVSGNTGPEVCSSCFMPRAAALSLSQIDRLERAVEFSVQLWTNSAELNELRATLRACAPS